MKHFSKIILSRDTHPIDHCSFHTNEGIFPPHCVINTPGAELYPGFEKLKELDRYNNPFVFRCTRKNKCEQFLSEVAIRHIGDSFRNIEKDVPTQDIESFYNFTKQRIKIDLTNVVKFMRRKEHEDYLWNEYSTPYENYTLYYEDMSFPFDIPALNLYNVTIEHRTEKLPDYKRDVFTNYDQVVEWFSKF